VLRFSKMAISVENADTFSDRENISKRFCS